MYYVIKMQGSSKSILISREDYDCKFMTNEKLFQGEHDECIEWLALNTDATLGDVGDMPSNLLPDTNILGLHK